MEEDPSSIDIGGTSYNNGKDNADLWTGHLYLDKSKK